MTVLDSNGMMPNVTDANVAAQTPLFFSVVVILFLFPFAKIVKIVEFVGSLSCMNVESNRQKITCDPTGLIRLMG